MSIQKNISISLVYQIGIAFLTFISLLLVTRILDVNSRGQLAIYANAVALGTTIVSFSLGSALVYFIAAKKMILSTALQQIIIVIGAALVLLISTITILYFLNQQHVIAPFSNQYSYLVIFVVHVVISIIQIYAIALLNADNNFVLPLQFQFGFILLQDVVLLLIYNHWCPSYFYNGCIPIIVIIVTLLFLQIAGLVFWFFKNKSFQLTFQLPKIYWPLFTYSAMAFACNIVQMLCYRIDIWFLQAYYTNSVVAVYAIAVACMQMLWLFSNQIVSVLFTAFAKQQNQTDLPATIAKIHSFLFWISLLVFSIALLFGYYCIPIFFGEAYTNSASLLAILLIGGIPFSSTLVITAYNASQNKMNINLIGSALGLLVCIIFNLILIPKYSYYGAAIASAIAYLVSCIYFWMQFCITNKINGLDLCNPSIQQFKKLKTLGCNYNRQHKKNLIN